MKKIFKIIISLIICISLILTIKYFSLSEESYGLSNVSYSSLNKKIIYFDLEKFINTIPSSPDKYDYLKVAFTIQGLVNRSQPVLYYKYETNGTTFNNKQIDVAWLDELKNDSNAYKGYTIETYTSFYDLIELAKKLGVVNGVVLWDKEVPATSNVASTIAGVENLLPIKYDVSPQSCYTDLVINRKLLSVKRNLDNKFRNISYLPDANLNKTNSGIASSNSSKNDAYLWAKKYYLDTQKTNSSLMGYTRDSWTPKCNTGACFVETYLPRNLKPNEEREVYITVLNNNISSGETWTKNGLYRIASLSRNGGKNDFQITRADYGFEQGNNVDEARLYLDNNNPVEAGERVTLKFKIKAPATNGTYHLNLGVVHDGYGWFSGSINYEIKVSSTSSSNIWQEHYGSYALGLFNAGLNTSDYLIQKKAFFFDLSPDNTIAPIDDRAQPVGTDVKTLKALLAQQSSNNGGNIFTVNGFVPWFIKYTKTSDSMSSLGDVPAEWKMVEIFSSYGGETDADAINPVGITNASIFSHVKLKSSYKQNNDKEFIKSGQVVKEIYDPNTIYFTMYMGDYDCGAWTSGVLPGKFSYGSNIKDKYPLAWAMGTDLSQRVPHVFNWLYKNQKSNDYFVAGDNGTDYLNPMHFSNLNIWRDHNIEMNKKFDIDITGFLIGGYNKITQNVQNAYEKMTPVLVGYQEEVGVTSAKVGNTPFIPARGTDPNTSNLGRDIYNILSSSGNKFMIIRTVQFSRDKAYSAIDQVYSLAAQNGKKIKVVDPYTLAYLYNNHPTSYKGCYTNGSKYTWVNGSSIPSGYSYVSGINSQSNCSSETSSTTTTPVASIKGDVNNDGKVNSMDYILVKKHILNLSSLSGDNLKRADTNGDGKVNSLDYITIRKIILG